MSYTLKCLFCEEKPTCYCGHVHKGREKIIAGFCKMHFDAEERKEVTVKFKSNCPGCHGEWKEEMGVDTRFGGVMFIDKDGIHPIDK